MAEVSHRAHTPVKGCDALICNPLVILLVVLMILHPVQAWRANLAFPYLHRRAAVQVLAFHFPAYLQLLLILCRPAMASLPAAQQEYLLRGFPRASANLTADSCLYY